MKCTWVGRARCLNLWKTIDEYLNTYVEINNTSTNEPWHLRWKELIHKYKILEKRDFKFIAPITCYDAVYNVISNIISVTSKLVLVLVRRGTVAPKKINHKRYYV